MATLAHTMPIDLRFFSELMPLAYPDASPGDIEFSLQYVRDGVIQIETLFETAISNVSGLGRNSTQGMDFNDGSDAKKTTVRHSSHRTHYSAGVNDFYNKIGTLRVMCYERYLDKFYYFVIPRHAYQHIPKSSTIEIPFNLDFSPRRIPLRKLAEGKIQNNWWKFEVANFYEMATKA